MAERCLIWALATPFHVLIIQWQLLDVFDDFLSLAHLSSRRGQHRALLSLERDQSRVKLFNCLVHVELQVSNLLL